jgi:hypothetical protein
MVNTFLPYENFHQSAQALDMRRLGKQRVEAYQLLRTLNGMTKGWVNHPCTNLWRGYEPALAEYALIVCVEWRERGYNDTVYDKVLAMYPDVIESYPCERPPIIGKPDFHLSHKSNLLRKDNMHYSKFQGFDGVPDDLPYIWA